MRVQHFALVLVLASLASTAAARSTVGLYADGVYADQLQGALYAALVNGNDILENDVVDTALRRLSVVPPLEQGLDELSWSESGVKALGKATDAVNADVLVLLRVKQRSKRHLAVTAIVMGRDDAQPLLSEVWTLTARGKKGQEQFNYNVVRNAITRLVRELDEAKTPLAQR